MTRADASAGRRPRPMHCRIVTLSDRAASGIYADRSGPRIRELLESFFADHGIESTISQCLLPDEAVLLRREILAAIEQGADVIITTGGTGVGPRDIAPDTVGPLCDKLIPGIMEHVRAKFGANNPRARLSRRRCRRDRNDADLYLARQPAGRRRVPAGDPRHAGTHCRHAAWRGHALTSRGGGERARESRSRCAAAGGLDLVEQGLEFLHSGGPPLGKAVLLAQPIVQAPTAKLSAQDINTSSVIFRST